MYYIPVELKEGRDTASPIHRRNILDQLGGVRWGSGGYWGGVEVEAEELASLSPIPAKYANPGNAYTTWKLVSNFHL